MPLNADISGGTLSEGGLVATIYNADTFDDAKAAIKSATEFTERVNKFRNDNQGLIGGSKATPVVFREFHRRGGEATRNDYGWAASNLHPSDAYKESQGARSQLEKAGQKTKAMTIKEALELDKDDPLYKGEFTEAGKKSLATITGGLQVTFIPQDKDKPKPAKDEKPKTDKK